MDLVICVMEKKKAFKNYIFKFLKTYMCQK